MFLLIVFLAVILLALVISILTKPMAEKTEIPTQELEASGSRHLGSAVRKETDIRKNYEENYRRDDKKWNERYAKILENKEDNQKLKKLQLNDTTKTKP
ncbi:MAG: hypothetical protein JXQ65_08560 [Candidatus Marinimicrobia bacterium]|nr:hypothetical protein [Candidatus Neomarinimicrobiota bacterium]